MFKRIKEKNQKLIRFLFGTFSATALMFTFQACYGMPGYYRDYDAEIRGSVQSASTGDPIQGISVGTVNGDVFVTTSADGSFSLPVYSENKEYHLFFSDEDGAQNGSYASLDTIVSKEVLTKGIIVRLREDNGR